MLSVTQRIKSVSQPHNGYVPKSLFDIVTFDDGLDISDVKPALSSIQGMVVDYLTRFILLGDKIKAFDISIKGAMALDDINETTDDYDNVMTLLASVNGLDRKSVINACKVVCYDTVYRSGIKSYQPSEKIDFDESLYTNIPILVNRCLSFLQSVGKVIADEFTFEGGYTKLVSSGDGDYLTKNTLIDVKVSKKDFSTKWSLQLLMYYLLGIHSIHSEFASIEKLCVFNPYKNQSYTCNIGDISDESKYKVSHKVLGYKMVTSCYRWDENFHRYEDYSGWEQVDGSDNNIIKQFYTDNFSKTKFKIDAYGDGIFDITIEDYWTYLSTTFDDYKYSLRPIFKNTVSVKLIKNNGYYMFVSVSHKGKYNLLYGAGLRSLKYSLEYYYDNIEKYATSIILHFSKYWDALREVSKQIQALKPTKSYLKSQYAEYLNYMKDRGYTKKDCLNFNGWYEQNGHQFKLSGKIHGCIVDIDWSNHIYVNPYDGTVVPYNALSKYDKNVYKNTRSLLSAQRPEMLPSFDILIEQIQSDSTALLVQNKNMVNTLLVPQDDIISTEFVKVYEYDMYGISNKIKPLQNIYDMSLIQVWYDEILNENKALLEDKYLLTIKKTVDKTSFVGQSKLQKNDMMATIIRYEGYKDVDVQFEDGTVVKHIRIDRWRNGTVQNPNKTSVKDKYIGLTKIMNCGLKATVIEYKDCKNVTVQFEDGLIKSGVRSDHFMNGNVGHSSDNSKRSDDYGRSKQYKNLNC
ncbi:MAG: hypothetical protein MRZ59_03400 [Clostridiales bacterium]|nr:hypothetical protein [Clostridiales bacterium]MDY3747102.1 hypothetical protein [Lachnospiraceae bacterium]